MAVLKKVYGTLTSPPTLRVLASLYEHDLDFEFVPIDIEAGEHKQEPFLSLNPFAEVPAFQDGDLTLFESRAIMRFIAFAYPKPGKEHIFKDPLTQGVVAAWIDVQDHQFNPPALKLINELIFKPKNGFTPDTTAVAEEEAKLAKVLDIYEERLGESKYLGGEKFTSADLTHLPNLYYLMQTPMNRVIESRPRVSAWCARIMARPAWSRVVEMVKNKY
ncbi:glutathione S-transferase PARB-like [Camellia sinensis]|uniref:glutathione S-transferase PARB-like n=1 Tax=Camellia sinensis TaxID=4442 RepID=UPI001035A3AD|nr:glutathione S-transferase PARB-like [Camellia sinensis]